MIRTAAISLFVLGLACGDDATMDDAGLDATVDSRTPDGGADVGIDAPRDTSADTPSDVAADVTSDVPPDSPDAGPCDMPCTPEPCFMGTVDCTDSPICVRGAQLATGTSCGVGTCDSAGVCQLRVDSIIRPPGLSPAMDLGPAIAVSGDRVVIGSPSATRDSASAGRVDIYSVSARTYSNVEPGAAAADGQEFGNAVAISGERLAASHTQTEVLVFDFAAGVWNESPPLMDFEALNFMNDHLWVEGSRLLVSGRRRPPGDFGRRNVNSFELVAGTWTDVFSFTQEVDGYARRFDVDGALAVVGGQGVEVEVLTQAGAPWNNDGMIVDPFGVGNGFGDDVAVSGSEILIGAPRTLLESGTEDGTVWLYTRLGENDYSGQELLLRDADSTTFDQYGSAVDFATPDRIVVGARFRGYAVVWERDVFGSWWEVLRLEPIDASVDDFGEHVAADGDVIVIYAQDGETGRTNSGDVFVVDLTP